MPTNTPLQQASRHFAGRTLAIATMHGKEQVLAPVLERQLGVRCVVPDDLDTDRFGTFTGEIPRAGSPLETARRKARAVLAASDATLAVASEGSFGPDPQVPLLTLAHELVLLVDPVHGLEIAGRDLGHDTNFAERHCDSLERVDEFADRTGFPGHRLIVAAPSAAEPPVKAIAHRRVLHDAARPLIARHGAVVLSTDMRAFHNPTRMRAVGRAGDDLARRCLALCPACETPGFGAAGVVRGLPCMGCGLATDLVARLVHRCDACRNTVERPRPDGLEAADPGSCGWCNP